MKTIMTSFACLAIVTIMVSCGGTSEQKPAAPGTVPAAKPASDDPKANKGIGPVKELTLGELDPAMAAEGEEIFKKMCSACHKPAEKFIGPAPKGILDRRSPEWIMNMILNPEEMVKYDEIAKKLLIEANLAPMANQHLTQEQARAVLEYFRTIK
ncbi:MAG TPA: c-type cytochrome [Bacteroidales bacterium]|nr:c-type cytochrome [Bacteroidales bacterium]HOX78187.1 c-type cytochrome [Bacteroidales bacterium]HPI86792.1 c-type cytochrome [Bacteroidales bacterium]